MTRKVTYIDVGDMSMKEACAAVGTKYTPWYKSIFFWGSILLLSPLWLHPITHLAG